MKIKKSYLLLSLAFLTSAAIAQPPEFDVENCTGQTSLHFSPNGPGNPPFFSNFRIRVTLDKARNETWFKDHASQINKINVPQGINEVSLPEKITCAHQDTTTSIAAYVSGDCFREETRGGFSRTSIDPACFSAVELPLDQMTDIKHVSVLFYGIDQEQAPIIRFKVNGILAERESQKILSYKPEGM